jgi:ribosomal protein S27E
VTTAPVPSVPVQFPCPQCGADVTWDAAAGAQRCKNCGATVAPPASPTAIRELDFATWARGTTSETDLQEQLVVHCARCGAQTTFGPNVTAGHCAFCGAAMSAEGESKKLIKPQALLPFRVPRTRSLQLFTGWITGLWFAPNALKHMARADAQRLRGVYLPFWTYDADTTTDYTGDRGDDYTTTETYTTRENGRSVTRTRTVVHTRWRPAAGRVSDRFDDVLVPAGGAMPRTIVDRLEPWDLRALVPFADGYLAGFESESYRIDLVAGFDLAKQVMKPTIDATIRADIGGDHQRIGPSDTRYTDVTFKHLLLPMWVCSYRFRDTVYRFVVNARTGEVQGERPWSWVKITFAVLVACALAALIVYLNAQFQQ